MTEYILNNPIIVSVLGGISYQLIPIIENLDKTKTERINMFSYDSIAAALAYIILSAILGLVYFGKLKETNPILVFQTGLTSILLVRKLLEMKNNNR